MSEAKQEDEKKRGKLLTLYEDAELQMKKLDKRTLDLLEEYVGHFEDKMKIQKERLKCKEYVLLVAGNWLINKTQLWATTLFSSCETRKTVECLSILIVLFLLLTLPGESSSGKSSLINLIMGEELLPYSVLCTTSTICELKFGEERKIVAHFKDKDPETGSDTKTIPLRENDPKTASEEESYLQQISSFVHVKCDREKASIYKKIELFWPHSLLQVLYLGAQ